jgi:hypothetical protein
MSSRTSKLGIVLALQVGAAFAAGNVSAQWEAVYGEPPLAESGARGVAPVRHCPGGGFIAVGSQRRPTARSSQVYVVYTDPAGGVLFENTYDVGAVGASSRGLSVVERAASVAAGLAPGFVVAGSTMANGNEDAFLMQLDCAGRVIWSNVYQTQRREALFDVIEAQTGAAAVLTAPGDIVAAGYSTNPVTGESDGLILRVKENGNLIWDRRYDHGRTTESLVALIEARLSTGSSSGDIVAVGSWRDGTAAEQGWALRVSGDNGGLFGGNHCSAAYGTSITERFTAVAEVNVPSAGQLVFAGDRTSTAGNNVLLVRSLANPCLQQTSRILLNPGVALTAADLATRNAATTGGSLLLTGRAATEAHLMAIDPVTLVPPTGTAQIFGLTKPGQEIGASVSATQQGAVIAGTSLSDFEAVGDPSDLYLITTDPSLSTNCDRQLQITRQSPQTPVKRPPPVLDAILTQKAIRVTDQAHNTAFISCP